MTWKYEIKIGFQEGCPFPLPCCQTSSLQTDLTKILIEMTRWLGTSQITPFYLPPTKIPPWGLKSWSELIVTLWLEQLSEGKTLKCMRCLFIPSSRPGTAKIIKSATLLSSALQRQVFSKGRLLRGKPWFSSVLQVHPPTEVVLGSQKKLIYSALGSHPFLLMLHRE